MDMAMRAADEAFIARLCQTAALDEASPETSWKLGGRREIPFFSVVANGSAYGSQEGRCMEQQDRLWPSCCCPLSQRKATAVYGTALAVAFFLAVLVGFMNSLYAFVLTISIIFAALVLLAVPALKTKKKVPDGVEEPTVLSPLAPPPTVPAVEVSVQPAARARLLYLDNLKSFLTAVVVFHHTTCGFVGTGWIYQLGAYDNSFRWFGTGLLVLNQSYFMCLFFFISAYFTPTSCDRKGAKQEGKIKAFMADKLKRLGLPFLAFIFVAGPLLDLLVVRVFVGRPTYFYSPNPGPCWFLSWLLVFNTAYTTIGGDRLIWHRPTVSTLVLVGAGVGLLQGALMATGVTGFAMMPFTFGSGPLDVLFFVAGVAAKRSGWLDPDAACAVTTSESRLARGLALFLCLASFVSIALCYYLDTTGGLLTPRLGANGHAPAPDWPLPYVLSYLAAFALLYGVCCTVLSFAAVDIFRGHFNFSTAWTKFFADSAYAVYIIHPWVVTPLIWSWTAILELSAAGVTEFEYAANSTTSHTNFGDDRLVWLGWIYAVVAGQLLVWPLAWQVRRLPFLRQVM